MQRIQTLVEKLRDFSIEDGEPDLIEIDIMLDHTKALYAELQNMRRTATIVQSDATPEPDFQVEDEYDIEESFIDENEDHSEGTDADKPRKDLTSSIAINDKYQLIMELFEGNKNAYEQHIAELNQMKTHQEALDWLNNNIFLKNWEEHSESVQLLFYIINKFFAAT